MRKLVSLLAGIVVGLVVVVGFFWGRYVTNTDSPYDEVGIELNSRMPLPIREWGCGKLKATFPNALPPHGCQAEDGTSWIVQ